MKKSGYASCIGLGKHGQRVPTFPSTLTKNNLFGLGYKPTQKDLKERLAKIWAYQAIKRKGGWPNNPIPWCPFTLNGYFLRLGDNFPYCGFREPQYLEAQRIHVPGFEVFNECQFLKDEGETINSEARSTID